MLVASFESQLISHGFLLQVSVEAIVYDYLLPTMFWFCGYICSFGFNGKKWQNL